MRTQVANILEACDQLADQGYIEEAIQIEKLVKELQAKEINKLLQKVLRKDLTSETCKDIL